jgi:hypothetical protein
MRDQRAAELVRSKVGRWVAMGMGGWNFRQMGMSVYCQELLRKWQMPLYISPSGRNIITGHRLLPSTPDTNPVREAYRLWSAGTAITKGRSSWDQVAVLFVARPELFKLEQTGRVERLPDGEVIWNPIMDKATHYLLTPRRPTEEMAEIIEELMARPPKARHGAARQE